MAPYLKIIRISNLIIVAVVQSVLYFGILMPVFDAIGIKTVLGKGYFILFIITTMIITAAGYVINDILDVKADEINKPLDCIVGRSISEKNAYRYYFALTFTGFLLALIIAIHINKIYYVLIYIAVVVLLYFYSKYLKKQMLAGNIFVSLFSSFVLGIILVFELPGLNLLYQTGNDLYDYIMFIFTGFMVFSFLTSMYRELVKDMEDIEGDMLIKAKTFPVVFGIELTKFLSGFIAIIILISLFYWMKMDINADKIYMKIYILIFVILPLFYSVFLLKNAATKSDFGKLSKVIKIIMATGISILAFYL